MAESKPIDWSTTNSSGLVYVGTHSLFVSTHGLPRTSPSQPIIVLINGTAATTARWAALIRALSPYARLVAYDRSNVGRSEALPDPSPPNMDSVALDLHMLLKAINLQPPYLLLGFSWGGMLATYFASTFPLPQSSVVGLVLLDAGAPTQSPPSGTDAFTNDPGTPWSHPSVMTIARNLDVLALTCPPERTQLTDDEYAYLQSSTSTPQHAASAALEFQGLQASYQPFKSLNLFTRSPPPFSSMPICLVHSHAYHSFQQIYDAGTSPPHNNGTDAERQQFRDLLTTWRDRVLENQKQFLSLTEPELGRSVMAKEETGHDVMMMDVEACVEGVTWVLGKWEENRRGSQEKDSKGTA